MAKVHQSILELIGDTPMVRLQRVPGEGAAEVYAKLEFLNPGGSVKDRPALGMIEAAEKAGQLRPGATIIEPTAGNTGVGLALVGLLKGYKVICVMPEKFKGEKAYLVQAMGGKVVFTPTEKGMPFAIETVKRMLTEIPGSVTMGQFVNPANPDCHEATTGAEIFEQLEGRIDACCLGAGTGGTFTGVARYLKKRLPRIRMVLVEPQGSVFAGGSSSPYKVEGIGSSFIPETLDMKLVDEVATIADEDTFAMVRELARQEGMLVGGSSGAIAVAACRVARKLGPGKRVACLFPDGAERYMSKFKFGFD